MTEPPRNLTRHTGAVSRQDRERRLGQRGAVVWFPGLCKDLGFAPQDRTENIRRVGEVAALLVDVGVLVLTSFISPYRSDRARVREIVGADFVEVFVDAPLAVCEARDPKGLYQKARAGEIAEFTGITAPYEAPDHPDLHLHTGTQSLAECAAAVHDLLTARRLLPP